MPFRASHNNLAEVSHPYHPKDLMIYPNGGNGQQPQQVPAVNQLAHRGRDRAARGFGSGTSSGFSSRDGSATPTLSDDGSTRQQQQQGSQNKQQAGVDTVRISMFIYVYSPLTPFVKASKPAETLRGGKANHTINGTGVEQPNIVLLANDSKKPIDATIDNNTASSGKQYNITGPAADVVKLMRVFKEGS